MDNASSAYPLPFTCTSFERPAAADSKVTLFPMMVLQLGITNIFRGKSPKITSYFLSKLVYFGKTSGSLMITLVYSWPEINFIRIFELYCVGSSLIEERVDTSTDFIELRFSVFETRYPNNSNNTTKDI